MSQCKWLTLATIVLFCFCGSAQSGLIPYYNEVMADNPLVYYQFDEAVGATTAVNYGTASSADGTFYNLTLGQTSAFAGLGVCGAYNGIWGTDGSTLIIPSGVTAMNVGTGDFSIELWYYAANDDRHDLFANKDNSATVKSFALINDWPSAVDTVCAYETGGTVHNTKPSAENEAWHHLMVTRTSGTYAMYIDTTKTAITGSSVLDFTADKWSGQKTIGSNFAGSSGHDTTQTLNGFLDEFAFYGTALTQERINAHYAAAQVPEPSTAALLTCGLLGLLAYAWRKRK
ncbi:MAG: LamG domain-containing protein [Pirellulaceae bacterium]|nr:LamG domain-containing protein [Pirellulaceae bacterium]